VLADLPALQQNRPVATEVIPAPPKPPSHDARSPAVTSGIAEGLGLTRVQKGEIRELTEQFYVTLRASFPA